MKGRVTYGERERKHLGERERDLREREGPGKTEAGGKSDSKKDRETWGNKGGDWLK